MTLGRMAIHDDPMQTKPLPDSERRGTQRSDIKEEAEGRGTVAKLSAASV